MGASPFYYLAVVIYPRSPRSDIPNADRQRGRAMTTLGLRASQQVCLHMGKRAAMVQLNAERAYPSMPATQFPGPR